MTYVFIVGIGFTLVFFGLAFYKFKDKKLTSFPMCVAILVCLSLALRLYAAYDTAGFSTDVGCFEYWGNLVDQVGMNEMYYQQDVFLDYPPGYITVLWLVEKFARLVSPGWGPTYDMIYCLPSIFADIICGVTLMYAARKYMCESQAIFVGSAYLFCPVTIMDSAQWGQVDSFCAMFLMFSIFYLYQEKWVRCGVLYGLSAICKPQMFVFVPVYIFFVLKQKKWKPLLIGVGSGLLTMLLVALPYTKNFNYQWLVDKYKECMGGYKFYSVNGYNWWTLKGMNWQGLPESHTFLTVIAPICAVVACGLLFLSKRKDVVFAAPALLMTVEFCFGIKQHERYLFPAIIFGLICYIYTNEIKQFVSFLLLSLVTYLNVGHIFSLFKGGSWQGDMNSTAAKVFSACTLLTLVYLIVVDIITYFGIGGIKEYVRKGTEFVFRNRQRSLQEDSQN